ncbi:MAG: 4-hydroxy-3-methylbut-2-enyl diphosphate reductase [Actinomycetia bacterium]|nr:4-hydroxy-3-methylbut-2-enyl diphosphate reductase [Actinomycetes bacterium]
MVQRVVLAEPRGFCAGVEMAIKALIWMVRIFEPPVYCYHEIVHNEWVVRVFERAGVVFVDEIEEVPPGLPVMLSAHGSAPQVALDATERAAIVIDSVCPLVTKVHHEVRRMSKEGYDILYIGHREHDEAVGTIAVSPDTITLVTPEEGLADFRPDNPRRVALLAQTTLGMHEWGAVHDQASEQFPHLWTARRSDLCYATTNRQSVVQKMAEYCDLILVVGSENSSNTQALVRVANQMGAEAHRINRADDISEDWLEGVATVGVTAGASAPEHLVQQVVDELSPRQGVDLAHVTDEDEYFPLPRQLRVFISVLGQTVEAGLTVPSSDWRHWRMNDRALTATEALSRITV